MIGWPIQVRQESVDPLSYAGPRVDFLRGSLPTPLGADPIAAVRDYLAPAQTESVRKLAAKGGRAHLPQALFGKVIWHGANR